jgi:hypothetical protein
MQLTQNVNGCRVCGGRLVRHGRDLQCEACGVYSGAPVGRHSNATQTPRRERSPVRGVKMPEVIYIRSAR